IEDKIKIARALEEIGVSEIDCGFPSLSKEHFEAVKAIKNAGLKIKTIARELFYVLTGALVIFCAMELAWDRVVLAYININWVLILWGINVMVLLIISKDKTDD
ncbi:hypothetical protein KKG82_06130, partial [Patescibacteria group bacterium]|nr:hypothetical protein [Patescibacteria group bacterium]